MKEIIVKPENTREIKTEVRFNEDGLTYEQRTEKEINQKKRGSY